MLRKQLTFAFAMCLFLCCLGCSSSSLKYDYIEGADYSRFKSFGWLEVEKTETGEQEQIPVENSLLHRRLRRTIDQQLMGKGYSQNSDNPDFLVIYHASVRSVNSAAPTTMYTYGPTVGIPAGMDVSDYQEGTLVLDFLDAQTQRRFWRAVAKGAIDRNPTPEKTEKKLHALIEKMLRKFPPS